MRFGKLVVFLSLLVWPIERASADPGSIDPNIEQRLDLLLPQPDPREYIIEQPTTSPPSTSESGKPKSKSKRKKRSKRK